MECKTVRVKLNKRGRSFKTLFIKKKLEFCEWNFECLDKCYRDNYLGKTKSSICFYIQQYLEPIGGVTQWVARLTCNWSVVANQNPYPRLSMFPLTKNIYPYCLVLVRSRNIFEHDFTLSNLKLRVLWTINLNVQ